MLRTTLAAAGLSLLLVTLAGASTGAAGDLDTSFDQDGMAVTGFETPNSGATGDNAFSVLRQPDGKLVVAGVRSFPGGSASLALARYNANGTLDPTFGGLGKIVPDLRDDLRAEARGMVRQASGKLVITGTLTLGGSNRFGVLRLSQSGARDETFADGGGQLAAMPQVFGETSRAIALQPDQKIVVAGDGCLEPCGGTARDRVFVVARYTADGTPDTTFGAVLARGAVFTNFGFFAGEQAQAIAVSPNGRIVAAGHAEVGGDEETRGQRRFALARYQVDGKLDKSFGGTGKVLTNFASSVDEGATSITVLPSGKVVVAGSANVGTRQAPRMRIALARYTPNGGADPTFDGDGKVLTQISQYEAEGAAIALQPDGKIVVAGRATGTPTTRLVLVRYNFDGSLDTTFGGDGKVLTLLATSNTAVGNAVALQPDGKIVAAGSTAVTGRATDFLVARYRG